MAKRKNKTVANNGSVRNVKFFRWEKAKEFTVMEDFVLQILEQKGALSDAEIARILCLDEGDVADIVGDLHKAYSDDVQGDDSRRSLCDGFSRKLPDGIAVAAGNSAPMEMDDDEKTTMTDFLGKCAGTAENAKLNSRCEKFQKEKRAKIYSLKMSFNFNDKENPGFRCGDICLPEDAHNALKRLLFPKPKSGK